MKRLKMNLRISLIALSGLFAWTSVTAQNLSGRQVPSVVVNEFQRQFPKAVDIDWELEKGIYEVEFEINRLDHEAWFDKEGRILKHKQEIRPRSLSDAIRSAVRTQYRGYRITEADKLVEGDLTVYKLELKSLRNEIDILVDEKGNVVTGFIW